MLLNYREDYVGVIKAERNDYWYGKIWILHKVKDNFSLSLFLIPCQPI